VDNTKLVATHMKTHQNKLELLEEKVHSIKLGMKVRDSKERKIDFEQE